MAVCCNFKFLILNCKLVFITDYTVLPLLTDEVVRKVF